MDVFGMIPVKFLQDKRMTHNDLKVYAALSSFQGKKENSFPKRSNIAERAGIKEYAVSHSLQHLEVCGWIEKKKKGYGQGNIYKCFTDIQLSEEVQQLETVQSLEEVQPLEPIESIVGESPTNNCRRESNKYIKRTIKTTNKNNITPDKPATPLPDLSTIWSPGHERAIFQRLYDSFYCEYPKIYGEAISITGKERGLFKNIETKLKGYGDESTQLATAFKKISLLAQIARKKNKFQDWHFTPDTLSYRWNDLVDGCIRDAGPPGKTGATEEEVRKRLERIRGAAQ